MQFNINQISKHFCQRDKYYYRVIKCIRKSPDYFCIKARNNMI